MRIKNRLVFDILEEESRKKAYQIANVPYPEKQRTHLYVIELFQDTKEYLDLMRYFTENPPIFIRNTEDEIFSESELRTAPLMRMVPNTHYGGYPKPSGDLREENYLSQSFDLETGCKYCTKGMIQNRPLRLGGGIKMGKRVDISGIWWLREFIITKRLKKLIEDAHLSGCELWPVLKHGNGKPFEDIFQLKITGELPPMASCTNIVHDLRIKTNETWGGVCPYGCGANWIEGRVCYNKKDLEGMPDFALTHEWFGMNEEFWRWPFMSHNAYQVFADNSIKGARFYPPMIIE